MAERDPLALVTGAGIRLGRAVSEMLAGEGYRLALHYHQHREQAEELAAQFRREGEGAPRAACFAADLAEPPAMEPLLLQVEEAMGPLDLLVLSAAIYPRDPLEAVRPQELEATLRVNLVSPFLLARAAGLRMKSRGRGTIVALLDWSVDRPYVDRIPYTMAKAGLRSGILGLARALAPEVRVNGVALGAVLLPEGTPPDLEEKIRRAALLKKIGQPADAAQAVRYLVQSGFVTGTVLTVDGGRSLA
jgi:NAD(P)-dependent dehydrogenase (short-subunit alcohol dehydrogenase family)